MIKAGRFCLLILSLFLLSGCDPAPNDDYDPEEGAPTHEEMFKELFGVEHNHNSVTDIFAYSKPPPLLGLGLDILWFMAAFSLVVIIVIGGIKSTLQAPTSRSLLGNDISTPIAPVRLGLAFFLLITIPGGGTYSMVESIILSANKYVSHQANNLYTSQVEKYKDEYIYKLTCRDGDGNIICEDGEMDDGSQKVNLAFPKSDYYRLFQVALCLQYVDSEGLNNAAELQPINAERKYSDNTTFTFAQGWRYNMVIEDGGFLWFDAPVEGGCGQWYTFVSPPEGVNISATAPSEVPEFGIPDGPLNAVIGRELQASVGITTASSLMAWAKFKTLAGQMIDYKDNGVSYEGCGSEPSATMSCEQHFSNRFNEIVNQHNKIISQGVNSSYNNVIGSEFISAINTDAIDMAKKHGWFFAGALPYMFASSAERLNAFDGIQLKVSTPALKSFPEEHTEKLIDYFAYIETVLGPSSSMANSSMLPTDKVSDGFYNSYSGCVSLTYSVVDCFGHVAALETLALTRVFASGVSHPLTVTHRIGKSGANSSFGALVKLRVAQGIANATGALLVGGTPFWGQAIFEALKGSIDTTVATTSPFLEYLMIAYTFLGFFVVLMPFIYFSIAIVSYVITLFVSVLAGNFFAVSHAWLEGQGMVSSYAQRGYPSLIFSALTPILIVLVFFIYLYTMPFMFKFLGYSYNLFLSPFMSKGLPGVFGGLFFFTMLIVMIVAIHRVWAKLILTIPDRVMRLIGVHEALTQNDFSQDIEQGGQGASAKISGSGAAGAGAAGAAISGNAGQTEAMVDTQPTGRSTDSYDDGGSSASDSSKSIDSGENTGRDTSGYTGSSGGAGGSRYHVNPRATGLGHVLAGGVAAASANRKSGQPDSSGHGNDLTDNVKSQDSSGMDANLRQQADIGEDGSVGTNASKADDTPKGYGNFDASRANRGIDADKASNVVDQDLRKQANTDLGKTESTDNDSNIRDGDSSVQEESTDFEKTSDVNNSAQNTAEHSDKILREETNDQSDLSDDNGDD
jgi:conjugal transfer/type IV secretion protein DotA/TraY